MQALIKMLSKKVRKGDWFSEELYARFNVIEVNGNFRDFNQKKQELINE